MIVQHRKWRSIESFANLIKNANRFDIVPPRRVGYRAKVKLHGTNAAINMTPTDGVFAQSRNNVVTHRGDIEGALVDGHYGFVNFVAQLGIGDEGRLPGAVIHGEWCGPGVQKGVACSEVDDKFFAIFSLELYGSESSTFVHDPDEIVTLINEIAGTRLLEHSNIIVVPWHTDTLTVDFDDHASVMEFANAASDMVLEVEAVDPLVRDVFGVEGIGEGLVYFPVEWTESMAWASQNLFKAKGEKHSVTKTKRPVTFDVERHASISEFVDATVPEARLEQAMHEVFGEDPPTVRRMADFLKWVGGDVQRECVPELEAAGLDWKEVAKEINKKAVAWLKAKEASLGT